MTEHKFYSAEDLNNTKRAGLIFVVIGIFAALLFIILSLMIRAFFDELKRGELTDFKILLYTLAGLFVILTTTFFAWNSYKELGKTFYEEEIKENILWSGKNMAWKDVTGITVYDLYGKPARFDIQRGAEKMVVIGFFYKDPQAILSFLKSKIPPDVHCRHKDLPK